MGGKGEKKRKEEGERGKERIVRGLVREGGKEE